MSQPDSAVVTPTERGQPLRHGDFPTLTAALDHAACAATGMNFHNSRGQLDCALPYATLRQQALAAAARFATLGLAPGARVALLAATEPEFVACFFGCRYAGLVPVPLPTLVNLGGRDSFTSHLGRLLQASRAGAVVGPEDLACFLTAAAAEQPELQFAGTWQGFAALAAEADFQPATVRGTDAAYIQFTSGSTRFPRGAVISEQAVMANLQGILRDGLQVGEQDRFCSWLPLYHDMGLVGKMLAPVAGQMSIDYLDARAFAMRPRLWPTLIHRHGATISFSPGFGYDLCARRLRPQDAAGWTLGHWRIAGAGAEMVKAEVLDRFARAMAPSGFRSTAFLPCYGMAEVALAATFSQLDAAPRTSTVHRERCTEDGIAEPCSDPAHQRTLVGCGRPLPGYQLQIRSMDGQLLPERQVGRIHILGPSTMQGYLDQPQASAAVLDSTGWLDTGDLGYLEQGELVVTGRAKDLIIVNGRNIWPQDLEYLAEQSPGIRPGDAAAVAVPGEQGDTVLLLVQCRSREQQARSALASDLRARVRAELGVDCQIALLPVHSLPRTSSGKLARAQARRQWLAGAWRETACALP